MSVDLTGQWNYSINFTGGPVGGTTRAYVVAVTMQGSADFTAKYLSPANNQSAFTGKLYYSGGKPVFTMNQTDAGAGSGYMAAFAGSVDADGHLRGYLSDGEGNVGTFDWQRAT